MLNKKSERAKKKDRQRIDGLAKSQLKSVGLHQLPDLMKRKVSYSAPVSVPA
jgi:hypothetical protein